MGAKSCFRDILLLHPNLVITGFQIQLRKQHRSPQFVQQFLYDWNWKFIGYGNIVKSSIVYTKSPSFVLLPY
ncbi:hypothetical protein Lalb_Chr25g0279101 [Lupinus albus]|uniref:Uncharacterized protein n=1 Tax=Lupinus albus TaxID=3870 RepID=A0A6A4N1N0_LUPAL|nr:hypothetical protein Lalb_Chr25g0279101 [Lupinus albus]